MNTHIDYRQFVSNFNQTLVDSPLLIKKTFMAQVVKRVYRLSGLARSKLLAVYTFGFMRGLTQNWEAFS